MLVAAFLLIRVTAAPVWWWLYGPLEASVRGWAYVQLSCCRAGIRAGQRRGANAETRNLPPSGTGTRFRTCPRHRLFWSMSGLLHWFSLDNCSGPAYVFWSLFDRLLVRRTVMDTTGNQRTSKNAP